MIATNVAHKIAKIFNMKAIGAFPTLTSTKYPKDIKADFSDLSGISIMVEITINKRILKEDLLFVHKSFSAIYL